jgi:hypothetical protein
VSKVTSIVNPHEHRREVPNANPKSIDSMAPPQTDQTFVGTSFRLRMKLRRAGSRDLSSVALEKEDTEEKSPASRLLHQFTKSSVGSVKPARETPVPRGM